MPRWKTSRELAIYLVAFYAIATIALGVVAFVLSERALGHQLEARIMTETSLLRHIHEAGGRAELAAALLRRDDRGVNTLGYLLTDARGARLGGELLTSQLAPGWHDVEFIDLDGEPGEARAWTVRLPDQTLLTVAAETAPVKSFQRTIIWLFAGGTIFMLALGISGAWLLRRQLQTRLDAINETARAITSGDMEQRIAIDNPEDEFGRVANTLNRMLDRNSALIGNLRQVTTAIAHDLRTPIAHLRQQLERAIAMTPAEGRLREEIAEAIKQSDAALSLFSALLRIAEVESGMLKRYFQPVDLSAAIRRIGESYLPVAEDSGHCLACSVVDGVQVLGDAELLSQALVNLLENALRHTPAGTTIGLELSSTADGEAEIIVNDDGPGVPEDLLPALAERFTRADRARGTAGFGLGLNLAKAVAEVHEGQLTLANAHPGFRARISLPLNDGRWSEFRQCGFAHGDTLQ